MKEHDSSFIHRFVPAQAAEERRPNGAAPEGDFSLTLLLLHGTGGSETDLLDLGRALSPHASLLSPRGQILENGMPRFFRRLRQGVFDEDDLKRRTHHLADFVAAAAERYDFAAQRVIAVGYSNGANIAASTLLLRPGALAGAILFRPMVPLVPQQKPILDGAPVFIAAGRRDPLVEPSNTQELVSLLQEAGARVTLRWHDGGHEMARDEIEAARQWLAALQGTEELTTDESARRPPDEHR